MIERECYKRLITRDKMRSELIPMYGPHYRPEVLTAPRSKFSGMVLEDAALDDSEIEVWRYRLKRVVTAQIYEYEEY